MKNKKFKKSEIIGPDEFAKYHIDQEMTVTCPIGGSDPDDSKGSGRRRKPTSRYRKNEEGGTGRFIEGFASTSHKDRAADVITRGALEGSKDDLLREGAKTVFFNHDTDKAIGIVKATGVESIGKEFGLKVNAMISKASDVEDIWTKIKEGILNSFSIRLKPKSVKIIRDEEDGDIQEFRILSMELFEVSVVGIPCNAKCGITGIVEKSFDSAKQKYNKERVKKGHDMNKNDRKETISDVVKEIVPDMIKDSLDEFKEDLQEDLKGIVQDSLKSVLPEVLKEIQKSASDDDGEPPKKEEKKSEESSDEVVPEWAKSLEGNVKDLSDQFGKLSQGRKGGAEDDDGEEDDDGVPKKCLKTADDPDTLKYVLHVMKEDPDAYDELKHYEQAKCKSLYFQMMDATQIK